LLLSFSACLGAFNIIKQNQFEEQGRTGSRTHKELRNSEKCFQKSQTLETKEDNYDVQQAV